MKDIFESWKRNRFIVADDFQIDNQFKYIVILTDIQFWIENNESLLSWCQEHNCSQQGMTVNIPDDETLTLFYLRW